MSNQPINIELRLIDKATASLKKVSQGMESSFSKMKTLGSQLSRTGTNIAFIGATISGPLVLALNSAKNSSLQANNAMNKLATTTEYLRNCIAESAAPAMDKLGNILVNITKKYESLSKSTRDTIVQFSLFAGIAATVVGLLLSIGGKLLYVVGMTGKAVSAMIAFTTANPALVAVAAALATLLYLTYELLDNWDKLKDKVKPVADALDVAMNPIKASFKAIRGYTEDMIGSIAKMVPGLDKTGEVLQKMAQEDYSGAKDALNAPTGQTMNALERMSNKLKDLKAFIQEIKELFGEFEKVPDDSFLAKNTMTDFKKGFKIGITESMRAMQDFNAMGKKLAQDLAGNMTTVFKNSFFHVMKGEFDKLSEDFQNFADSVLMSIAEIMAQMAAMQVIQSALGVFGKAWNPATASIVDKMHSGGPIRMHSGGEVPILAKAGEYMVSERGVKSVGTDTLDRINRGGGIGDNVTIAPTIVIQAWDASDIVRNRSTIEAIFIDSLQRNRSIRSAIKRNV